jgi:sec-independent protein translocase protein TatB
MFDIGFSEIFLILVIALMVVGPERLPSLARKIGGFIGKAKRSFEHIKREVASEFETEELNKQLSKSNIFKETKEAAEELKNLVNDNGKTDKAADIIKETAEETMDVAQEIKDIINKSGVSIPKDKVSKD